MYKCFRFLGCFGLISACVTSYGDYPPPKELLRHLLREQRNLDETFKQAFGKVRLETCDFVPPIFGEGLRSVSASDSPLDGSETMVFGDFSRKINGTKVSDGESIQTAVKLENISSAYCERITKVCQILLSERFARVLLGKNAIDAIFEYDRKGETHSDFSINFERFTYDESHGVFWFRILYSQQHRNGLTFMVGFHLWYDIERDCFATSVWDRVKGCDVPYRVEVSCFWINDYQIRLHTSGLTNADLLRALEDPRESGVVDVYSEAAEDEKDMTGTVSKEESVSALSQGTQKSFESSKGDTVGRKYKKRRGKK
jgi:hypothetical protein